MEKLTQLLPFIIGYFLLLPTFAVFAQDQSLKMTILNAEDNEPVSFATVSFPTEQYGFSANAKGQFVIKVNRSERNRKIMISSIGFEQYSNTLGNLLDNNSDTIYLKPAVTMLDEILIRSEAETPEEMIKRMTGNLTNYLRDDPYYLFAFYREGILKNHKYVGFSDAYGILHVAGYEPVYNRRHRLFSYDLAQWKNLRRSNYGLPFECDSSKKKNLSIDKLTKAKSEYLYNGPLSRHNHKQFNYSMDSITTFNNVEVFVIGFKPDQSSNISYEGTIYVKADDYALLAMNVYQKNAIDLFYDHCNISSIDSRFTMTFTKIDSNYFLNTMDLSSTYIWNGEEVNEMLTLRSGEFRDNKVAQLNYDQRVVIYNEMLNPSTIYDPDFWKQYGEDIPLQAIQDLGGEVSLEDQFMSNSAKRANLLPDEYNSYDDLYKDREVFRMFMNMDF